MKTRAFGILQVFVILLFFSIIVFIIQSMISSYQRSMKTLQLRTQRDAIAAMIEQNLLYSVAALSYTTSKCTNADYINFLQNPVFCLCLKERRCLASPSAASLAPDGFPFVLYRSEPQNTYPPPLGGGMVSFCSTDAAGDAGSECKTRAQQAQYLNPLLCPAIVDPGNGGISTCINSITDNSIGIPTRYKSKRSEALDFVSDLYTTTLTASPAEKNVKDFFADHLNMGSPTNSMLLLPQYMARYTAQGERCVLGTSDLRRCPFAVDLRFKVECPDGKAACEFKNTDAQRGKIQFCYTIYYEPPSNAPGASLAPVTNLLTNQCTTLKQIIQNSQNPNLTSHSSSSSDSGISNSSSSSSVTHLGNWSSSEGMSSSGSSEITTENSSSSGFSSSSWGFASSSSTPIVASCLLDPLPNPRPPFLEYPYDLPWFTQLPSNSIRDLYSNGSMLYVISDRGLSISSDQGTSFRTQTTTSGLGFTSGMGSLSINNLSILGSWVYANTPQGLYYSSNSGSHFEHSTGLPPVQFETILPSGSWVYVNVLNGPLYVSSDYGASFVSPSGLGVREVKKIFVSGPMVNISADHGIFHSTDRGMTFSSPAGLNLMTYYGAMAASGSLVYAGSELNFYRSTDSGATYTPNSSFLNGRTLNGISASDAWVYVILGTADSMFYYSSDQGASFQNALFCGPIGCTSRPFVTVSNVLFSGAWTYAITSGGLYISQDNGRNFRLSTDIPPNPPETIAFSGSYVHVTPRYFWSSNYGMRFNFDDEKMYAFKKLVASGSWVYASIPLDGLYRSSDNGLNFSHAAGLENYPYHSLVASGSKLFVGTAQRLFSFSNSGANRTLIDNPVQLRNLTHSDFAVSDPWVFSVSNAGFFLSSNNGNTFIKGPSPGFLNISSVSASGSWVTVFGNSGTSGAVSRNHGSSFEAFDLDRAVPQSVATSGSMVYLGTKNGLFVSQDQGAHFVKSSALASASITNLSAHDSWIYAGTNQGLFISNNQGAGFERPTDPDLRSRSIMRLFSSGNSVYILTDQKLYKSDNNGNNTTVIQNYPGTSNPQDFFLDGNLYLSCMP